MEKNLKGFFKIQFFSEFFFRIIMPIYFTSDTVQPPATIYMGVDKHENEDLIKWGWPEDGKL